MAGTPKGLLHAKQCKNVEDEYNKAQQTIIQKLNDQENIVVSNTEFVESIWDASTLITSIL